MRHWRQPHGLGLLCVLAVSLATTPWHRAIAADDSDWSFLGGDPQSHQYSALSQINSQNVGSLGLLWYSDLPVAEGLVGNPLVSNGVVYQSGPWGRAVATDLRTGATRWSFDPQLDLSSYSSGSAVAATVNHGLGMDQDNVYVATGCVLFAIQRKSGSELWRTQICEPGKDLGAGSAPRVGEGKVFVGVTNLQRGTQRGYAAAFDALSGKELWRFYTVPGDPTKPHENAQMALAAKTWGGRYWTDTRGSGGVEDGMVYDPQTGLLILGAASPGVDGHEAEFAAKPMLFADSLIAVNASTGQYAWHLQEAAGDVYHVGDATAHLQLAELRIGGRMRHVLMQAAKNGYFYVVDAKSGQLLSADQYGVPDADFDPPDKATGTVNFRKALAFWNLPAGQKEILQPGAIGAHTWQLCSYNSDTGLVYIPALVSPYSLTRTGRDEYAGFTKDAQYPSHGLLIAWDPIAKQARWQVEHPIAINGGVLSTAGQLVFQGTPGKLSAYDARTGQTVWSYDTHSIVLGAPSTVMFEGKQIILVPAGDGAASASSKRARLSSTPDTIAARSRLLAFALGGSATVPPGASKSIRRPALPHQPVSLAQAGSELFEQNGCGSCHGDHLLVSGNGRIPDLRNISEPLLRLMGQIVRDGVFKAQGMPRFANLSEQQITDLQAYITNAAWDAYESQGKDPDAPQSP